MQDIYLKYLDLISDPDSGEYWYEFTANNMVELAFQLDSEDWERLEMEVSKFPAVAKEKCLYTIGEANPDYSLLIAVKLLNDDNSEVVSQALSTIDQIADEVELNQEIIQKLLSITPCSSLQKKVLKNIQKKWSKVSE